MNAMEPSTDRRIAALEARFGMMVSARLNEGTSELPHDITERLRHARQTAMASRKIASSAAVEVVTSGSATAGTLTLGGSNDRQPWWAPLTAWLPWVALLLGLGLIQHVHVQNQIAAAAEVDAALLSDDLPPEAYSDPGFVEYLKTARE